jgi:hypothetical protein
MQDDVANLMHRRMESTDCRVEEVNQRMNILMEEMERRVEKANRRADEDKSQRDAIWEWSAKISAAMNNVQLVQGGLSPLKRYYGDIMQPLVNRKKRARHSTDRSGRRDSKDRKTVPQVTLET